VDDLREGLNQVIDEVRSGVVPPVGGRIITLRATGETAFVGFGSVALRSSESAAIQAKLNLDAQKIAGMRAKDALCGLIIGDKTSWEGSVSEKMKDQIQEFEQLQADDPLAKNNAAAVQKLDKARQDFMARMESTDIYQSARQGILPPGINTKTWFDDDHAWAYAMSVFVPSLTAAAKQAKTEMEESRPIDAHTGKSTKEGSGFTDEKDTKIKRPPAGEKQGPTGKVSPDKEQ